MSEEDAPGERHWPSKILLKELKTDKKMKNTIIMNVIKNSVKINVLIMILNVYKNTLNVEIVNFLFLN